MFAEVLAILLNLHFTDAVTAVSGVTSARQTLELASRSNSEHHVNRSLATAIDDNFKTHVDFDPIMQDSDGATEVSSYEQLFDWDNQLEELVSVNSEVSMNIAMNSTSDASCLQHTGGTCFMMGCSSWRGPTTCRTGRCFCAKNYCAGAEGVCHQEQNHKVGTFKLRNARWPDHYLYISSYHRRLLVGKDPGTQADFNFHALPGQKVNEEFVVESNRYRDWAATIIEKQDCSTDSNGRHDCDWKRVAGSAPIGGAFLETESSAESLAVRLLAAPEYEGAPNHTVSVMIESYRYPRNFMFAHSFNFDVSIHSGDPGAGGYWLLEPNITIELSPYRGPRCSYNCGSYGSGTSSGHVLMTVLIVVGAVGGFGCCSVLGFLIKRRM